MAADSNQLDEVLRALADPTRRGLYAALGRRPGLTTGELVGITPGMTRWGVMKHLEMLRRAGLVQTLPEGRRRRHYVERGALEPLRAWLDLNGR